MGFASVLGMYAIRIVYRHCIASGEATTDSPSHLWSHVR